MKRFFATWAALSSMIALTVIVVRWANHPGIVDMAKTNPGLSAMVAFGLGWFLRAVVLRKKAEWVRGYGLSFVLFWIQSSFFVPIIPSHDMDVKILWPWAIAFCLFQFLYLGWEEWTGALEGSPVARAVPMPFWVGLFAAGMAFVALKVRLHPSLTPNGVYSDIENYKNLALTLAILFWGLAPMLRRLFLGAEPLVFRALGFFLLTLLAYRAWPDTLHLTYYDKTTHKTIDHDWTPWLVWAHFILSGYISLFWERLREKRWGLRSGAIALAVIPLIVSTYFDPYDRIWIYQILGLAVAWAWEPWLRERWWDFFRIVGAWFLLAHLSEIPTGGQVHQIDFYIFTAAALAAGWRQYIEKVPAQFLRTLWIILFSAFLFTQYSGTSGDYPWEVFRPEWLFFLHLVTALLLSVYWDRLRTRRQPVRLLIPALALLTTTWGFAEGSFLWFFQWFALGAAWVWDGYGEEASISKWGETLVAGSKGGSEVRVQSRKEVRWGQKVGKLRSESWVKGFEGAMDGVGKGLGSLFSSKWVKGLVLSAVILTGLYYGGIFVYRMMATYVVSMTPTGTVSSLSTVVRIKFSAPVEVKGNLQQALVVTPDLPGSIRLEDSTTLVFTPAKPLRPATTYEVKLNGTVLVPQKGYLQSTAHLKFNTEPFKVVSSRLFYTYDLMNGFEKELAGELEFNYPVDLDRLKNNFSAFREGKALSVSLEPGTLPNRFFFRAEGLARETREQILRVHVGENLACADCGGPLGKPYETTLTLPARPKFEVKEVRVHNQPGSSLIAILFSKPVSKEQVKAHLTVSPSIPIKIQTEYCYVVLRGDFQPNIDYRVILDSGLQCLEGDTLDRSVDRTIRLQDAAPRVRFADRGRLIPTGADPMVAVKTVNLDNYNYEVHKVFRNNLVTFLKGSRRYSRSYRYFQQGGDDEGDGDEGEGDGGDESDSQYNYDMDQWSDEGIGAPVTTGSVTVEGGRINEEVETRLKFKGWQAQPWKGLFTVQVNDPQGGSQDARWFLVTDLGLLAKRAGDDLWVQALSISKVKAEVGVKLSLVSDNNQVIAEAITDETGRAWFKNWKNNPYNFTPLAIVAEKEGDWSFLKLADTELNSSRFDTGGDEFSTQGWDGFLTTDRGLYRPGDTVHFTGVVRQADLTTPLSLPVRLKIFDTGGTEMARYPAQLNESGMAVFTFPLRGDLTTGTYSASLELEKGTVLARTDLKVEEFIPNKIKAEVVPQAKVAAAGENLVFDVRAHHLFGAAAAALKVRAHVELRDAVFKPKDWESYKFSDDSRTFEGDTLQVPDGVTDDKGVFSARLPIPLTVLPSSMLEAVVYAEVFDTGGRPVGASSTVQVHRYPVYLGLKSDKGRQVSPGKKLNLRYIAITPEGKLTKVGATQLVIKRKRWYSVFRQSGWSGRGFESSYYEETVLGKEVTIGGKGSIKFTPDKPGEYTVYLGNDGSMRTSYTFVATGLGSSPDKAEAAPTNLEAPEKLSLILSQKTFQPGEKPQIEVRAPFAGTLILTVEREKVYSTHSFAVPQGLSVLSLPAATSDYFPNVYVVGVLVRPPLESLREMPGVSFGITPLMMDLKSRKVSLDWADIPAKVRSREGISVDLDTGAPGAQVVLAAVDEGILDIVDFKTPDPFEHFYRKRSLTTETLSLFDDVLPQLDHKMAVGGGEEGPEFSRRHLNPIAAKRVKSYAQFSGILTADKKGKVTYHFPTNEFHGEVRVMALAVEGKRFGASARSVNVADPVVVEPSFPRFLAPLDIIDVPVLLYNQMSEAQALKVDLTMTGPVAVDGDAEKNLTLPPGGQTKILFHAKAKKDAGVAKFTVAATDAKGEVFDVTTELAVRPANPLTTEVHYGELAPGKEDLLKVPGGFIPEGQRIRMVVSSSPLLTFLQSLDSLIQYPWGCTEQLTSQAFPLLYFEDMGLLTGRFADRAGELQRFVQAAIDQIEERQWDDGGFALWPSTTRRNDYLSNYTADFLFEAKAKGYDVKDSVLERIKKRIGAIRIIQKGGRLDRRKANLEVEESTYVLYLKALAGTPDKEMMDRFKEQNRKDFYLSLAYSQIQDRGSALQVLPEVKMPDGLQRKFWDDWFSPNKYAALYLLCLTRADPTSPKIRDLVLQFGQRMKNGEFGTTQDNAWCFRALGEAVKTFGQFEPLSAGWKVVGGVEKPLKGETAQLTDRAISGHDIQLVNHGTSPLYYNLMAEGTRLESKKDNVENGITVSREYRDEDGKPVNLGSITQGQLVVVTLKVECAKPMDNLVVVEPKLTGFPSSSRYSRLTVMPFSTLSFLDSNLVPSAIRL